MREVLRRCRENQSSKKVMREVLNSCHERGIVIIFQRVCSCVVPAWTLNAFEFAATSTSCGSGLCACTCERMYIVSRLQPSVLDISPMIFIVRHKQSRSMSLVLTRAKVLHFATSKPALVSTLTRDSTWRCAKNRWQLPNAKVREAKLACRARYRYKKSARPNSHFA